MNNTVNSKKSGFTLVELLVVITILAVLAALTFSLANKMVARGKATRQMENVRQIGPLIATYSADHLMKLPPAKAIDEQPDGSTTVTIWHELLLAILYPETDPVDFKTKDWWDKQEVFLRNPLFKKNAKPRGWDPLNPGYGLNEMIAENLARASTGTVPSHDELELVSTPLAALQDPGRTPLVAPCDNYYYRYDPAELGKFERGSLKDFLSEGKVPVLFVDGHVETIRPDEYERRNLHLMPFVTGP
jgi:prepilin-type N-terminal cleavage/methylation domain-containing protein/prepilin-type processing-associated H-X9-DG protein